MASPQRGVRGTLLRKQVSTYHTTKAYLKDFVIWDDLFVLTLTRCSKKKLTALTAIIIALASQSITLI